MRFAPAATSPRSLTGQYLSGRRQIAGRSERRAGSGQQLVVRGGQENNLKEIDVALPLGLFTCITGVSGSGKSTLVNEILYKKLYGHFHDSRILPGRHRTIEGIDRF